MGRGTFVELVLKQKCSMGSKEGDKINFQLVQNENLDFIKITRAFCVAALAR